MAVADWRILSTPGAIVVLAICVGLVSPTALSQACAPTDQIVNELFRHSQLAERHTDRERDESCSADGTTFVHVIGDDPNPRAVPISDDDLDELKNQLREAISNRALAERPSNPDNINTLYVGCGDEIFNLFDVAVEMRFYRRDIGADIVQLDVVYRQGDGDDGWRPLIDIFVFPGTPIGNPLEVRQWLANFSGEGCPFTAARFAVYAMCEHASAEEGDVSDSSLRMEDGMPVVVGHSLGGAATQFIATSRSSREDNGWPTCPGVDAYAFGSIGLTPSSVGSIRGTLKTYASDCDWLVSDPNFPFSDRIQAGHLFTLSSNSHLIDSIQHDLCGCLRGDENHELYVNDPSEPPQTNRDLCEHRN